MLNNRWFVFGLVGVAVLMVLSNVVRPLLEARKDHRAVVDTLEVDVENALTGTGIETPAQGEQFDSAQRAIQKIDSRALHWDERPYRDPFFPVAVVPETALDSITSVVSAPAVGKDRIRWPVVSAVVDSRRHQYAIVDGEIRRPGDRFAGFLLNGIDKHTVELTHASSRSVRRVKVTTQ
ncbi:MAG: hypothetical protein AAFN07_06460 [Pseudomonadota bacterium]